MPDLLQLIILSTIGAFLLWFGYSLFVRLSPSFSWGRPKRRKAETGRPGEPRVCPVCSVRLIHGERVKSSAFPSMGDGKDRLMHIFGCPFCLAPDSPRQRLCPVCGRHLASSEYLIARMFDKPRRSHVHVLGCSVCRGPRSGR